MGGGEVGFHSRAHGLTGDFRTVLLSTLTYYKEDSLRFVPTSSRWTRAANSTTG